MLGRRKRHTRRVSPRRGIVNEQAPPQDVVLGRGERSAVAGSSALGPRDLPHVAASSSHAPRSPFAMVRVVKGGVWKNVRAYFLTYRPKMRFSRRPYPNME